jgi:7,8-dihydro-6-hydroxymethylpterin dimethyltransferase
VSSGNEHILSETESVCPECLARIPAQRVARGEDVYLRKSCPEHGAFSAVIWRGQPAFASWTKPKLPSYPEAPFTAVDRGCPYDCGLCPDHRQDSCSVLLEVTARCDLGCPVCFADAGSRGEPDPDLITIGGWYRRLLDASGPFNIQLSGGEPCLRDDLPEIIAQGRSLGFTFFQLNTNGLRLAWDPDYLRQLRDVGLSTVFLQFDGTREEIHRALRGRELNAQKQAAIAHCAEHGIGVVLVPTLVPGVNTGDIGAIIDFALDHAPAVRGVHFQPISYLGRYPSAGRDLERSTIPEIIRALEVHAGGKIGQNNFAPPGCENALCSFHGNFVIMPDGQLIPLTSRAAAQSCCSAAQPAREGAARTRQFVALHWAAPEPEAPKPVDAVDVSRREVSEVSNLVLQTGLGEWDAFLERAKTHSFCISGMAFQDAWTLDLERLRDCCIHVMSADGRLIPFCAYNLTARSGRSLYRFSPLEHRRPCRD